MQLVHFGVELIIADDCSTDKTERIVEEISKNHPKGNWIKHTQHKENKGIIANSIWSFEQAKGKYAAICEGDDYWTDTLKL